MAYVQLYSGFVVGEPKAELSGDVPGRIEKDVLLVYTGTHQSADGPVDVTDEHLERLVNNHNSVMSKLTRLVSGAVPVQHRPPLQLDHSPSARDTVGRVLSEPLRLGEYEHDGKKLKAVYGKVEVLGRENVERVMDGRWASVSVGADFDEGKLSELTITPFPAALSASLLKAAALSERTIHSEDRNGHHLVVTESNGIYRSRVDTESMGAFKSKEAAISKARDYADKWKELSQGKPTGAKMGLVTVKEGRLGGSKVVIKQGYDGTCTIYLDGRPYTYAGNFKSIQEAWAFAVNEFGHEDERKRLTRLSSDPVKDGVHRGVKYRILPSGSKFFGVVLFGDGTDETHDCATVAEAERAAKNIIDEAKSNLSQGDKPMDLIKRLKAFLTGKQNLSEKEADEKLAKMSEEEKEELSNAIGESELQSCTDPKHNVAEICPTCGAKAKLSEGKDEKAKELEGDPEKENLAAEDDEKDEAKKAELTARKATQLKAKTDFVKLAKELRTGIAATRTNLRKATLATRLSALRGQAKITPAEIKKVNLDDLIKKTDEAVDAFFQGFEARQPVIMVGQYGTQSAENVAELTRQAHEAKGMKERLSNMPFTAKMMGKKLGAENDDSTVVMQPGPKQEMNSPVAPVEDTALTTAFAAVAKLFDEGNREEALRQLQAFMQKCSLGTQVPPAPMGDAEPGFQLAALAQDGEKLHNQLEELVKLVVPVLGVETSEME